jgi:hypothetical protein
VCVWMGQSLLALRYGASQGYLERESVCTVVLMCIDDYGRNISYHFAVHSPESSSATQKREGETSGGFPEVRMRKSLRVFCSVT